MVAQLARMPRQDRLRTISKASEGTQAFRPTPASATTAVRAIPPQGTPALFILPANLGAEPARAIEWRIRPVEYRPALSDDSAAVSTTMFMIASTPVQPIDPKNVTNGLTPAS